MPGDSRDLSLGATQILGAEMSPLGVTVPQMLSVAADEVIE
jgi:hypothetical protein